MNTAADNAAPPSGRVERSQLSKLVNDPKTRGLVAQALVGTLIVLAGYYLVSQTIYNMEKRGLTAGFDFLWTTAGFDIGYHMVDFHPTDNFARVFLVGIINTLFVSAIAIVFATIFGFIMGVARLSPNWLISRIAATYVEIIRNTPLLLQILVWYGGVFTLLPPPRQALEFGFGYFVLSNRAFQLAAPIAGDLLWITGVALLFGVIAALVIRSRARKQKFETGDAPPWGWKAVGLVLGLPLIVFFATGAPLSWDVPELKGFNYRGGFAVPPPFMALLIALSIYTSAFIAEIVRAGIQSVGKGQSEAAHSLGLPPGRTLRLVVIPQAMRAIIPPLISQYLNIVKNSSLGVAIAYPDLVAVWMQTSLNQAGRAIEIVATTMLFYMTVSLTISALLNVYNKRVQLKER